MDKHCCFECRVISVGHNYFELRLVDQMDFEVILNEAGYFVETVVKPLRLNYLVGTYFG